MFFSLSKLFLIASLFSIVIVTHSTIFPFVVGKTIVFRVAVALATIAALIAWGRLPQLRLRFLKIFHQPLVQAVTVFIAIFSLAGVFGYDPHTSFWSTLVRGEGVFQMWHYYVFFLVAVLCGDDRFWRNFFLAAIGATLISLVGGLPQYVAAYHLDNRFKGLIGNPAFTAAQILFAFWYGGIVLMKYLRNKVWYWIGGITAIVMMIFFILTGSRAAFLGLAGAGIVALAAIMAQTISPGRRRVAIGGMGIVVVLGSILLYWQPIRLFRISLAEQTAQTRIWTWQSALRGWQARPILGWGPENFSEVFNREFDIRHYRGPNEFSETWFDRAHNVFIDYLAETGMIGFLSYCGIWITYYYQLRKKRRNEQFHSTWILLFTLPVMYLIQGMLLFETFPALFQLFAFLAYAQYQFSTVPIVSPGSIQAKDRTPLGYKICAAVVIIIVFVSVYVGGILPFRKALLFNQALAKIQDIRSVEEFKNNFSPAVAATSPYGQDEIVKMLSGVVIDLLQNPPAGGPPPEVAKALAGYVTELYQPIFDRGKGNVFAQDYVLTTKVNELAGESERAKKFYREGNARWPRRPEFQEGLDRLSKKQ